MRSKNTHHVIDYDEYSSTLSSDPAQLRPEAALHLDEVYTTHSRGVDGRDLVDDTKNVANVCLRKGVRILSNYDTL